MGSVFVLGAGAVGLATLGQYLMDPARANAAFGIGQNMQSITLMFHITFGVILALSFFWGLLLRREALAAPWLRVALLVAAAAAALVLHVLAYRTGLLVFYVGLLAYALRALGQRRWVWGLALLLLLGLGPWVAFHSLESVRQRVDATLYDVEQYTQGHDLNNFSLSRRLVAVETARVIIAEHWLFGVGPADTQAAMREQYQWRDFGLRPANRVEVHNQYLQALLGGGLVGLALLLAVLLGPFAQARVRRNPYIGFFVLIQGTAMMVDSVLALQIGLNLFVFGYGFLIVAEETASNVTAAANQLPSQVQPAPIVSTRRER
ncbi:O-antigen ligase family protein [Hymenobacter humi]|uniref:O-antigen ligase family protein n=1 Tax=Hymenobacter humi TaxID=1411620 RepID=A0ABW2U748_9BACT